MNIVALRGRGNSGKTNTIRRLHQLMIDNGYRLIETTFNAEKGDFRTVFQKKGKLVGITSSGDTYDLVHSNLSALIDAGCIFCICACRTYDRYGEGTNAAIDDFAPTYQK